MEILYFPISQFSSRFGENFFSFKIRSWKYNRDPTFCSLEELYIEYELEMYMGRKKWSIFRRFSDLIQLHYYLVQNYPNLQETLPHHPPKSCYRILYNKLFIEHRIKLLEAYLNSLFLVLSVNKCLGDGMVGQFFQFDRDKLAS